jgi:DNA-directed RNA polymerase beta subunit
MTETKQVSMGLLPVMVKSNLCWLHKLQESDCQFDFGGYFLIKGTEKVLPDMIHAAHSILRKCISQRSIALCILIDFDGTIYYVSNVSQNKRGFIVFLG